MEPIIQLSTLTNELIPGKAVVKANLSEEDFQQLLQKLGTLVEENKIDVEEKLSMPPSAPCFWACSNPL